MSEFDETKEKEYAEEAKKRWGGTKAWSEYEAMRPAKEAGEGLLKLFCEFGELKALSPEDARAQEAVGRLKEYVTQNYYTCTDEILSGLGRTYAADERFRENIDRAGGEGTAEFTSRAIEVFCRNR